jgi:tetratricopeptide (TPR) repeat protein
MKSLRKLATAGAMLMLAIRALAAPAPAFDEDLLSLQQAWAHANYEMPAGDARNAAFDALEGRAADLVARNPARAEALIWQGIIESSHAGVKGGLGALGLCKDARASLEAALKLNPAALDGSAYTSLGALYYKVPGFPIGFGDDDKAARLLQQALQLNPAGIDPNYFYAEYLFEQGRYAESLKYLEKAAQAAPRPGREVADKGRRAEIAALSVKVQSKLS